MPCAKKPPQPFAETDDREADHLRAAAGHRRAARKAGQAERRADRRAADWQRQRDADRHRNDDAHQERLKLRRPHDQAAGRLRPPRRYRAR